MTLLPRPSIRTQRRLTRGMQLVLAGIVAYGVGFGAPKAITNGSMGLFITFVPALMERKYDFPLDPWLGLWITQAGLFAGVLFEAYFRRRGRQLRRRIGRVVRR